MDLIDSGMGSQPRSPGVVGDDAERIHGKSPARPSGPADRAEIIIHRIELQQADPILNKQLV